MTCHSSLKISSNQLCDVMIDVSISILKQTGQIHGGYRLYIVDIYDLYKINQLNCISENIHSLINYYNYGLCYTTVL